MVYLQGLVALLKILPQALKLLERFEAYSKQRDLEKWFGDLNETFDKLEKAETLDDKRRALEALGEITRRL
jgi:hypothetical protein